MLILGFVIKSKYPKILSCAKQKFSCRRCCGFILRSRWPDSADWLDADIAVKAGFDSDQSCEFAYKSNNQVEFVCKDICKIYASDIARVLAAMPRFEFFRRLRAMPTFATPLQSNRADAKNDDEKWGLLKEFARLARETGAEIVSIARMFRT